MWFVGVPIEFDSANTVERAELEPAGATFVIANHYRPTDPAELWFVPGRGLFWGHASARTLTSVCGDPRLILAQIGIAVAKILQKRAALEVSDGRQT